MEIYKRPAGELKTKENIQDEEWYWYFSAVVEIKCAGADQRSKNTVFFEHVPNGLEKLFKAVRKGMGRDDGLWKPRTELYDERLLRWLKSIWLTKREIKKIQSYEEPPKHRRPRQYYSCGIQRAIMWAGKTKKPTTAAEEILATIQSRTLDESRQAFIRSGVLTADGKLSEQYKPKVNRPSQPG